jgi:hypothetical protein
MRGGFRQVAILHCIGLASAELLAEAPPMPATGEPSSASAPTPAPDPVALAGALGITFVKGSSSTLVVERQGKKYLVDLSSRTIREVPPTSMPASAANALEPSAPPAAKAQEVAATQQAKKPIPGVFEPGDDFVFSLPNGRRLDWHGFYINFNHRFAFEPAFSGSARGAMLLGLDSWALPSFGLRYGVTDKFSVSVVRSPSFLDRPIELMAAYNFLDEHDQQPLNAAFRFSVDGQDHFSKNFTYNFERIFSRSFSSRAQLYVVPTLSLQNRRLISIPYLAPIPDLPAINSFSLGVGGALDIRPTVARVAEVIPTLASRSDLSIHRPAYSFGIQKKIWRHTFGFGNGPGSTVAQRAGTRATLINRTYADTPGGLFIGFDLTRQVY